MQNEECLPANFPYHATALCHRCPPLTDIHPWHGKGKGHGKGYGKGYGNGYGKGYGKGTRHHPYWSPSWAATWGDDVDNGARQQMVGVREVTYRY